MTAAIQSLSNIVSELFSAQSKVYNGSDLEDGEHSVEYWLSELKDLLWVNPQFHLILREHPDRIVYLTVLDIYFREGYWIAKPIHEYLHIPDFVRRDLEVFKYIGTND